MFASYNLCRYSFHSAVALAQHPLYIQLLGVFPAKTWALTVVCLIKTCFSGLLESPAAGSSFLLLFLLYCGLICLWKINNLQLKTNS